MNYILLKRKASGLFIISLIILSGFTISNNAQGQEDRSKFQKGILLFTVGFNKIYNFRSPDIQNVSVFIKISGTRDMNSASMGIEGIQSGKTGFYNILNQSNANYKSANELLTNNVNDIFDFDYIGRTTTGELFIVNEDSSEFGLMESQRETDSFTLLSINVDIIEFSFKNLGYSTDLSVDIIWEFWVVLNFDGPTNTRTIITVAEESSTLLLPFSIYSFGLFIVLLVLIHRKIVNQ